MLDRLAHVLLRVILPLPFDAVLSDHVAARHLPYTSYVYVRPSPGRSVLTRELVRLWRLPPGGRALGGAGAALFFGILRSELCASALVGDSDGKAVCARAPGLQNQKRKGIRIWQLTGYVGQLIITY